MRHGAKIDYILLLNVKYPKGIKTTIIKTTFVP